MTELKKITQQELDEILSLHELWLESKGEEGAPADFSNMDLQCIRLVKRDLSYANFKGSKLYYASFEDSYLRDANFEGADFKDTIFTHSYIAGASFLNSNFREEADTRWGYTGDAIFTEEDLINKDKIERHSRQEFSSWAIMD